MTRPYEKLSEEGTYWNIRVPVRYKTRAREIAKAMGISPAEIARNGIEKEIHFLETLERAVRNDHVDHDGEKDD